MREEEWRTWRDQALEKMQSRKSALVGWKHASNGDTKGLWMLATVGGGRAGWLADEVMCRTQDRDLPATDTELALMALSVLRMATLYVYYVVQVAAVALLS